MYTMSFEVLAVEQLAFSAVMAISAELRVIRSNFVSNLEALYRLADLDNDAAGLVSCNHRHCRVEIAIVDVKISPTDTARLDYISMLTSKLFNTEDADDQFKRTFYQYFMSFWLGDWHRNEGETLILLYRMAFISAGTTYSFVFVVPFMACSVLIETTILLENASRNLRILQFVLQNYGER